MSFMDADELAEIRADRLTYLTDKAYILRPAVSTDAGAGGGALSNGAGGVKTSVTVPPPAHYLQVTPDNAPIPCKLSSGMRYIEVVTGDAAQARSQAKIKLPYTTVVKENWRIRVVTDVDDMIYEVNAIEPKTDRFTQSVRVTHIA